MIIAIWQKYYAFYDPTFNYNVNPNYPVSHFLFNLMFHEHYHQ